MTPATKIYDALGGKMLKTDDYMCFCPAHPNTNSPALHVVQEDDMLLLKCFTGCTQSAVIAALIERELWDAPEESVPTTPRPSMEELAAQYGLTANDFKETGCTLHSNSWGWGVRYPIITLEGKKSYKSRSYSRGSSGKRSAFHVTGQGCGLFPAYPLPREGKLVIVGGEEKAIAIRKAGIEARSWSGGEQIPELLAKALDGREIVIAFDNDTAGKTNAIRALRFLPDASIATIPDPYNDYNDVLLAIGLDGVRGIINSAVRPVIVPEGFHLTDMGNADRLIAAHGPNIRYVYEWENWVAWNSTHWQRDSGAQIAQMAQATAMSIRDEAANAMSEAMAKPLYKWAHASQAGAKLKSMVEVAKSRQAASPASFDAFPMLLNVSNGTIELETGSFRSHSRADMLSMRSSVVYDPKADCPRFRRFCSEVMGGNMDNVGFLQRAAGYSMTGDTSEQKLFICWGNGANGKSKFFNILAHVLGDYWKKAESSTFAAKDQASPGGARPDLVALRGARFVTASEFTKSCRLDEATIKSITGGEFVAVRDVFEKQSGYLPQYKLWLGLNHKPVIKGQDHGIWRRLCFIPWLEEFQINHDLEGELLAEASGVLNWALDGLKAWQAVGLDYPSSIQKATDEFRHWSDTLGTFFETCCELGSQEHHPAVGLYDAYRAWAGRSGQRAMSGQSFIAAMEERGFARIELDSGQKGWRGISVTRETLAIDAGDY